MSLPLLARIVTILLSIYFVICLARVLLTWIPFIQTRAMGRFFSLVADPYLNFFRLFRLLSVARFDFSPIAALAVLTVLIDLFGRLSVAGSISLGFVLALIAKAIWAALGFIIAFFAVFVFLRLLAFIFRWNSFHPLWVVVDSFLNPLLQRINSLIYRNRPISYVQGLITGFVVLSLFWLGGAYFFKWLEHSLQVLIF